MVADAGEVREVRAEPIVQAVLPGRGIVDVVEVTRMGVGSLAHDELGHQPRLGLDALVANEGDGEIGRWLCSTDSAPCQHEEDDQGATASHARVRVLRWNH